MKKSISFSLALTIIALLLQNCVSVRPENDTKAPRLSIWLNQASPGLTMLANSDPNQQPTALGCPAGTFWVGNNTNTYFLDLPQTVSLTIISNDKGAVRDLSIVLSGSVVLSDVNNVEAINDPGAEIEFTQLNPAEVQVDVSFQNLRTGQILILDVATNDEGLIVTAETSDFSNNRTSLPQGNTGGTDHGGQIIDIAICNN